MVMNYTEAENLVYEATNEDPWGPTGPQMKEIANCTFQYDGFNQVTNLLWKRMLEDNKNAWKRVYKSLMLLNYLLLHGSERVIGNARDHIFQMRALEQYKFVDDRGRDQGLNVRHRVKTILELLNDDDKLRAQRKKMKSDAKDRYQGYTSDDIRMGRAAPYGANSFQDEWKDDSCGSYKDKSFDDIKDDYSSKEVNSFQFPEETRRGSVSPELGFRQDPAPEDDFGDFATARSIAESAPKMDTTGISRIGAPNVPALRPPTSDPSFGAKIPSASMDLLTLDASDPPKSCANTLDFFQPPVQTSPLSHYCPPLPVEVQPFEKIAISSDLFGTASSEQVSNHGFVEDWSLANPTAKNVPKSLSDFASFDAFDTQASFASVTSTPSYAPAHVCSPDEKPTNPSKIGSTWAGASNLIDLDNLASKSSPVKQGPSLKQMQMNKQTTTM
ncbi:ENTH domain protein [Dictyocaulus viviparus]|uniref:ENTH domain protein n=1 Tax=Dictyocaulus viviparus TaxID=29172 RepID=A0A0D8XBV4_DICVI|nr:ENTH domain protein [Dictyocaulus viviparus]